MVCLMGHIAVQTYRALAVLGIRSCMLVCCSRSCPLTSASQKLSNIVLFERCFLDIEQFQTHHFQQFLVIPQLCRAEQFRRSFPQYAKTYMPGCRRCHLRPNAPVQGLAWYVACCCVLSDGTWTLRSCRPITSGSFSSPSNGVASPTSESRLF